MLRLRGDPQSLDLFGVIGCVEEQARIELHVATGRT